MTKEEILALFRDLKSRSLFSSELDKILTPAKGQKFSMELSFSSASPCLGRQIDSFYDNGYKAECSIDGEDLEFIVLFSKEHSDFVDNSILPTTISSLNFVFVFSSSSSPRCLIC